MVYLRESWARLRLGFLLSLVFVVIVVGLACFFGNKSSVSEEGTVREGSGIEAEHNLPEDFEIVETFDNETDIPGMEHTVYDLVEIRQNKNSASLSIRIKNISKTESTVARTLRVTLLGEKGDVIDEQMVELDSLEKGMLGYLDMTLEIRKPVLIYGIKVDSET